MIFVSIGTLTFLASLVIFWRRAVEMRANRWHLYRLRDELRRVAYEDPALLSSDVFRTFDGRLTAYCTHINSLSMWEIMPAVLLGDFDNPNVYYGLDRRRSR